MPAGWHPDPYERAEQRYWDGERWTEHVIRGGVLQQDALTEATTDPPRTVLDQLGPDAKERPDPDILGALSAGGAVLVAGGVLALFAGDDGNRPSLIVGCLILVAAAYVIVALLHDRLRPAAVALAAIGGAVFVGVAFADSLADGELTGALLVLALVMAVMYAAPGLRGRPLLLGLTLLSLVAWITYLVAKSDIQDDGELSSPSIDLGSSTVHSAYGVLLVAGLALLIAAFLLDRARFHGVATVFIAVAIIAIVSGAIGLASDLGDAGGAILLGLAGLALAIVGHHGRRRFSTWLGAIAVPYALAAIVFTMVSNDDRVGGGILLAVFGAALVLVCLFLPQLTPVGREERESSTTP